MPVIAQRTCSIRTCVAHQDDFAIQRVVSRSVGRIRVRYWIGHEGEEMGQIAKRLYLQPGHNWSETEGLSSHVCHTVAVGPCIIRCNILMVLL